MQKQAPSPLGIAAILVFALSCFGLLLMLWMSFGGPSPFRPKGYRFEIPFSEATQLAIEADVRVAGVEVGKVKEKRVDERGNRTIAVVELDRRYAPIASDARATLRQKTLLGQTYIELTTGSQRAPPVPEGGRLANRRVSESVQLDEILDALDPYTRAAYRTWQQSLARGVRGRGQDLNDSLGNLPAFVREGGDLFQILDQERQALRLLVRNTGVVFAALTEREDQLRNLVVNTDDVFSAIASEREAFAQVWQTFPTFLQESRLTYDRLRRFSLDTHPLVRDLIPAVEELRPTLRAVGDFGPDLKRFFRNLDPLLDSSRRSLPATRQIFAGLEPLLGALGPWLSEINPILEWIGVHQHTLTDMFANLGVATAARTRSGDQNATGHYLRQFGPSGVETAAIHSRRLAGNRGNAYINPLGVVGRELAQTFILPSFDCRNSGGPKPADTGTGGTPACRVQQPFVFKGVAQGAFPHVTAANYRSPR
jgi:phospholipid/cholesterol/gamma-HCH transport system substrate-binding protein